jgi:type III secretory pathway component EscR
MLILVFDSVLPFESITGTCYISLDCAFKGIQNAILGIKRLKKIYIFHELSTEFYRVDIHPVD